MRDKLRTIILTPYRKGCGPRFRLITFDVNRRDSMGKHIIGYEFWQDRTLLFAGEDFHCPPLHAIDSDAACASLLVFLTLRPGDTDAAYFAAYTPAQLEFAATHAETLSAEVYARFGDN